MRKKRLLSYEAKIILGTILIILLAFLSYKFFNNIEELENYAKNLYIKHISIYPIWAQISAFLSPFILYLLVYLIRKNRSDYKEDIIYDIKWTWSWSKDKVVNLQCFCPTCNTELYYDYDNGTSNNLKVGKLNFICGECNKIVGSIPNTNVSTRSTLIIKKEIERIIKKRLIRK